MLLGKLESSPLGRPMLLLRSPVSFKTHGRFPSSRVTGSPLFLLFFVFPPYPFPFLSSLSPFLLRCRAILPALPRPLCPRRRAIPSALPCPLRPRRRASSAPAGSGRKGPSRQRRRRIRAPRRRAPPDPRSTDARAAGSASARRTPLDPRSGAAAGSSGSAAAGSASLDAAGRRGVAAPAAGRWRGGPAAAGRRSSLGFEFFFVAKIFCKIFPLQNFFLLKVPCFLFFQKSFCSPIFFFDFPS